MDIREAVLARKSVRGYSGVPLRDEHLRGIETFIRGLAPAFGGAARLDMLRGKTEEESPGTYGSLRGARDFLLLIHDGAPLTRLSGGYMLEEAVLFCTRLGLGTAWLALFSGNFAKQVPLRPGEKLTHIAAVGYPGPEATPRLMPRLAGVLIKPRTRKAFGEIFFLEEWGRPLPADAAGAYALPLEMLRLAPSALNRQPWRMVRRGQALHFYRLGRSGANLDLGIALCHFALACREQGVAGRFAVLDANGAPAVPGTGAAYVISWLP
jgi:nitroreductase